MGYSPTEYAEFTEPPAEMSSHGFHRFTQILRVRCSPTEFTEYTEFGSVGMAGMPYPPTSVLIRVICGSPFSARGSVYSVFRGNLFPPTDFSLGGYGILPYPRHLLWDILPQNTPNSQNLLLRCPPTDFTDLHRYLGCAVLPQNSQNSQNSQNLAAWVWQGCHTLLHLCSSVPSVGGSSLPEVSVSSVRSVGISFLPRISQIYTAAPPGVAAWVWQECHTLLICEHPCHLWEALLCKRFCVFGAFRGSFFTACSVGAAETAAPPGGIHRSSVQISPPQHLTTSPPISPRTLPSACPPRTVGTTSSPPAAR